MQGRRYVLFADSQYENLVIGKQILLDSLAEAYTVNFIAIHRLVVHRTEHRRILLCLALGLIGIKAWSSSHIDAMLRLNEIVAMHLDKCTLFLVFQRYARCAVSLIAYNQVEYAECIVRAVQNLLLCFGYDLDGLVGGKYHRHALAVCTMNCLQLIGNVLYVGRCRQGKVYGADYILVVLLLLLGDLSIGADTYRIDWHRCLLRPRTQGLT